MTGQIEYIPICIVRFSFILELNMEKKSTDRRVRYTKLVLKQTLMQMLQEKPLKKISTSELCRRADISRNTFYTYYRDPEELLQILMNKFSQRLYETVLNQLEIPDILKAANAICDLIKSEPELSKWLLTHLQNSKFVTKAIDVARDRVSSYYRKALPDLTEHDMEYVFNYMCYGTLHMLLTWVNSGLIEPSEDVAQKIYDLNEMVFDGVAKALSQKNSQQ